VSTDKTPERLYCIAIEEWVKGKVVETHLVYVHADNIQHAVRVYRQSQPNSARYHVVTAGKVIAYKVLDTQGLILSV
jgi:hypothetical protein